MTVERALLAAFAARLGPPLSVAHDVTPWHSATFSGARHCFALELATAPDARAFAMEIADADVAIPRGFVADVEVVERKPGAPGRLEINVLTIDA